MAQQFNKKDQEFRIPLELKTVLKALRLKIFWLIGISIVACILGVAAAILLGTQKYEATTVLLYQPIESFVSDTFRIYQSVGEGTELSYEQGAGLIKNDSAEKTLINRLNMVKTYPNLEALRRKLNLARTLDQLGSSISVDIEQDANLMFISAQADNAKDAQEITNTIRDIFLSTSNAMVVQDLEENLHNLQMQYDHAVSDLAIATTKFNDFVAKYDIRDLAVKIEKVSSELIELELTLPKTEKQADIYRLQIDKLNRALRAARNLETGEIDTDLVKSAIDPTPYMDSGSSSGLTDYIKLMQTKLLDKELQLIEVEANYTIDKEQYQYLKDQYENLPAINQQFNILTGRYASLEAETRGLEKILQQLTIITDKDYSDFYIVSDAMEPLYPLDSNKKLIAIAITAVVFIIGFVILLITIIFDTRIKSAGDAFQKLQVQVLAEFPRENDSQKLLPSQQTESTQIELYRILARPLRIDHPKQGTTFLITSTLLGEGKSTAVLNLAAVYGRQDEHVLVIDAQVRNKEAITPFTSYRIPSENPDQISPGKGLGEYLSYTVSDPDEIIIQTTLPGVDMIMMQDKAIIPDLLQTSRMRELMEELKTRYSIILIEGPPVEMCVDAEVLTHYCDATLFVTACNTAKPDIIREALSRLEKSETPTKGLILTKVMPAFYS
jgi:protein-tyrosine kinase